MSQAIAREQVEFALETWKKTVEVQQHFNTIEMQIRSIAVTVLTATVGVAGLVYSRAESANPQGAATGPTAQPLALGLSASGTIVLGGLVAWLAFYFMDRWWYHRLLQGAVKHAEAIEADMASQLPYGGYMALGSAIRDSSPFKVFGRVAVHSDRKIDAFYGLVGLVLILIMLFAF